MYGRSRGRRPEVQASSGDYCFEARLSHKPVQKRVRQSVVGQRLENAVENEPLSGIGPPKYPLLSCPSHR
jgi:hypothetical protein